MKSTIKLPKEMLLSRVSPSKLSLLITVVVVSVMMILTNMLVEFERDSIVPTATTAISFVGIIVSIALAFALRQDTLAATGSPLRSVAIDYSGDLYHRVEELVKARRWDLIDVAVACRSGRERRVELIYSKDFSFAAYQFFSYVPHQYEPSSEIHYIPKEKIDRATIVKLRS